MSGRQAAAADGAPVSDSLARGAAASGRRRADARRSIDRIVTAARRELGVNPTASVDDVAKAAGVGRMTLYGHFRTRAELVEAALVDVLAAGEAVLGDVDLGGEPPEAMRRLLHASWSLVAESVGLLTAADGLLPAERLRQLHDRPAERVEHLIRRGQSTHAFRADLPLQWLISAVHMLVHGAAAEVRAGRLSERDAPDVLTASVLGLLANPIRQSQP